MGDWENDPGDDAILEVARQEARVFVTMDKDFGELAVKEQRPHHGIVRIVGFSARQHGQICLAAIAAHGEELAKGALVTAEPGRLRIRPPENP